MVERYVRMLRGEDLESVSRRSGDHEAARELAMERDQSCLDIVRPGRG